ncbi:MAG: hypothetical protein GY725_20955 [bacterium]|nr:hypothetical protein [bacterium]
MLEDAAMFACGVFLGGAVMWFVIDYRRYKAKCEEAKRRLPSVFGS